MKSPAQLIQEALVLDGVGTAPADAGAWPIFYSHMPKTGAGVPLPVICTYNSPATVGSTNQRTGKPYVRYGLQVRVRATGHDDGWTRMQAVITFLDSIKNMEVVDGGDTVTIHAAKRTSDALVMGPDPEDQRAFHFSVNATLSLTTRPAP